MATLLKGLFFGFSWASGVFFGSCSLRTIIEECKNRAEIAGALRTETALSMGSIALKERGWVEKKKRPCAGCYSGVIKSLPRLQKKKSC